jgi:chromosome segregation ATPase
MFGINISKSEYNALKQQLDSKVSELAEADLYVKRLNTEIEGHKETIEQMAAKHAVEITALKSHLEKTEKSVNSKVNNALSSLGVVNFAVETIYSDKTTPPEALKKFMTLSGEAKTKYYNEHKDIITQALGSSNIKPG